MYKKQRESTRAKQDIFVTRFPYHSTIKRQQQQYAAESRGIKCHFCFAWLDICLTLYLLLARCTRILCART